MSQTVILPSEMRGVINYVVVLHPKDGRTYSIGIKFVLDTAGCRELIRRLILQNNRKHKKPLHSNLCTAVVNGTKCELGKDCPSIHINEGGFKNIRTWNRPIKIPQKNSPTQHDSSSESDGLSSASSEECLKRQVKLTKKKPTDIPTYTVHRPYDGCLMTVIEPKMLPPQIVQPLSRREGGRSILKTKRIMETDGRTWYDEVEYLEPRALQFNQPCHQCQCQCGRTPWNQFLWNGTNAPTYFATNQETRNPTNVVNTSLNDAHRSPQIVSWADYSSDVEMEFLSDEE